MDDISQILWAALGAVAGISTVTVAVTNVINGLTKATGFWPQLTAWIVAILFTGIAHLSGMIPSIVEPQWLTILATGILNGLVSNGIYDIPIITKWLETWFPKK